MEKKIIDILEFNSVDIIGSKIDPKLKYFSDIDLEEFVETNLSYADMFKEIQKKIKIIKDSPNIYLIDFKSGFLDGQPLRWNYDDIAKGYKYIDGRKINFIDTLTQNSIIKIDIIYYYKKKFIQISINYYFNIRGNKTFKKKSLDDIIKNMIFDSRKNREKDLYKSIKILYYYYKLKNDKKNIEKLLELFNSDIGKKNKYINSLKFLILLLKNKERPKKNIIIEEIQNIRRKLKKYYDLKQINNLNKFSIKKIVEIIEEEINFLKNKINDETIEYIKRNNIKNIIMY